MVQRPDGQGGSGWNRAMTSPEILTVLTTVIPAVQVAAALMPLLIPVLLIPWVLAQLRYRKRRNGLCAPKETKTSQAIQPEAAVIVELLVASLQTGVGIPRALAATGQSLDNDVGKNLTAVGTALLLGAPWDQAWRLSPAQLRFLARTLRPAWEHGAPPTSALEATRTRIRRQNTERTELAAQRLTVHLVLPLGLCYLPSFILLGVVPILFSLGGALLFTSS